MESERQLESALWQAEKRRDKAAVDVLRRALEFATNSAETIERVKHNDGHLISDFRASAIVQDVGFDVVVRDEDAK